MKITEAQLRQIILKEVGFSEADPEKRKEAYKSFDWACGRLVKIYKAMPEIFEMLDGLSNEFGDDEFAAQRDELEEAQRQVSKVYQKLNVIRKELEVRE